ncbi:hypothetical protein [Halanaerobium congolense]|nr:hypothetical protein [Halanaerobium congolense]SET65507.1 hypothetical protein SAMN04515653_12311 [Halanaerobium congolense]
MSDYVFVAGEDDFETITKVSAESIEQAKTKYAKKLWEIDNLEKEEVKRNGTDSIFWGKFASELFSRRDGGWIHEIDKTKKLFKANLEEDFSPEISEELIEYYFDIEKDFKEISDKTKFNVAKFQVEKMIDDNHLRIYPLDEMKSIS